MRAILLIDHGSVKAEANQMLDCVANMLQSMVGPDVIVRAAHMELAEPLIPQGVDACVEAGATDLVVFPYMLSPGKHSTRDIPRIAAEATRKHPGLRVRVSPAFGVHAKLAEVIAERAGVDIVSEADCTHCWNPDGQVGTCGDACCARAAARESVSVEGASARS
ncbi:MAG TPA: CbiX/SirB N-terminal domain-containing protein [Gemmatimonadaceae bacterium]|jgi:sirohydrochlorin ferrochelatase